jgi:cell division protein FtsB
MRDIGTRIQRYRLSRYERRDPPLLRRLRWAWPLVALWLVYVGFLSEHSLYRLWRLNRENERLRTTLGATRQEIEHLDRQLNDPRASQERGEHALRERNGMGRRTEIIYRYADPAAPADSASR